MSVAESVIKAVRNVGWMGATVQKVNETIALLIANKTLKYEPPLI